MIALPSEFIGPVVHVESCDLPEIAEADRHHLGSVVRLRPGASVVVADGAGACAQGVWNGGVVELGSEVTRIESRTHTCCVGFALAKGDRPELVVQKLTELGVDRIVPLMSARTVVRWDSAKAAKQQQRLARIAVQACAQSRRLWFPEVVQVTSVEHFASENHEQFGRPAVAQFGGASLRAATTQCRSVAVGPEGGWTEEELELFDRRVTLGETVLRSETAAIVAGALLMQRFGSNEAASASGHAS